MVNIMQIHRIVDWIENIFKREQHEWKIKLLIWIFYILVLFLLITVTTFFLKLTLTRISK